MRLLSYILRDIKITLVFLTAYLVGRMRRGGKRSAIRNGLRVSMEAGGLGEQDGRREFTGIGRYADELITGLLRLRPDMALRVYTEGDYSRPEVGERYSNIPCRNRTAFAIRLARDLAAGDLDILHLTDTDSYFSHLLPALLAPVSAITVHDVTPIVWPGYLPGWRRTAYRWVLRRACRKCAMVFVNSEYTKQDLQRVIGGECPKIVVTPLGV
ncbi:MAG TPA: glycosyltransferase, partial [Chthonomonadaceae bacterium]|nr:glycosyltransferase [Chthonomonadaceae bacterium]